MKNPRLKTVIQDLEKLRQKYLEKYGKEPVVWLMTEDNGKTLVELCGGTSRKGCFTTSHGDEMEAKISMGMM